MAEDLKNKDGEQNPEILKDGEQVTKVAKKKDHPKFGAYKKCIVDWKEPHKAGLTIFVSINDYTATFKPETEVELPAQIIRFLKEATYEEHYQDKADGKHKSRSKRKYVVELVEA